MRWAILGIGRVTNRMVQAIAAQPGHSIAMVAGREPKKLALWGEQHREAVPTDGVVLTSDFEAALRSPDVDAVYVALPPSLHAEWSIRALAAGKRVLCEKPLAVEPESASAMLEAATQAGMPLTHATAFVHHPRSAAMREIVRSGELGEVHRVTVACTVGGILDRHDDHRMDASVGGGCLLDLGWYCVYATLWFTGMRPQTIQAIGTRYGSSPGSVWQQVQAIARLNGGVIASWDCGYDVARRMWIEIAGSRGSVICDDFLRPWDLEKPRFWVHDAMGKARSETVGAGVFQESEMIKYVGEASLAQAAADVRLGLATQEILSVVERSAHK